MIEKNIAFTPTEKMIAEGIQSLDDIIRMAANKAASVGDIHAPIANDFPARSKAYRDLAPQEWSEVRSITMERHFALN